MDDEVSGLRSRVDQYINSLGVHGFQVIDTDEYVDPRTGKKLTGILVIALSWMLKRNMFLSLSELHPDADQQISSSTQKKIGNFLSRT